MNSLELQVTFYLYSVFAIGSKDTGFLYAFTTFMMFFHLNIHLIFQVGEINLLDENSMQLGEKITRNASYSQEETLQVKIIF